MRVALDDGTLTGCKVQEMSTSLLSTFLLYPEGSTFLLPSRVALIALIAPTKTLSIAISAISVNESGGWLQRTSEILTDALLSANVQLRFSCGSAGVQLILSALQIAPAEQIHGADCTCKAPVTLTAPTREGTIS